MKLIEHPTSKWIGAKVLVSRSTQRVGEDFSYQGQVLSISGGYPGRNPRVLIGPPNEASFIQPKWLSPESLEVVEIGASRDRT